MTLLQVSLDTIFDFFKGGMQFIKIVANGKLKATKSFINLGQHYQKYLSNSQFSLKTFENPHVIINKSTAHFELHFFKGFSQEELLNIYNMSLF